MSDRRCCTLIVSSGVDAEAIGDGGTRGRTQTFNLGFIVSGDSTVYVLLPIKQMRGSQLCDPAVMYNAVQFKSTVMAMVKASSQDVAV